MHIIYKYKYIHCIPIASQGLVNAVLEHHPTKKGHFSSPTDHFFQVMWNKSPNQTWNDGLYSENHPLSWPYDDSYVQVSELAFVVQPEKRCFFCAASTRIHGSGDFIGLSSDYNPICLKKIIGLSSEYWEFNLYKSHKKQPYFCCRKIPWCHSCEIPH